MSVPTRFECVSMWKCAGGRATRRAYININDVASANGSVSMWRTRLRVGVCVCVCAMHSVVLVWSKNPCFWIAYWRTRYIHTTHSITITVCMGPPQLSGPFQFSLFAKMYLHIVCRTRQSPTAIVFHEQKATKSISVRQDKIRFMPLRWPHNTFAIYTRILHMNWI